MHYGSIGTDRVEGAIVESLKSGEQAPMPLPWIPQGIFDLLFEDEGFAAKGEEAPALAVRLARA